MICWWQEKVGLGGAASTREFQSVYWSLYVDKTCRHSGAYRVMVSWGAEGDVVIIQMLEAV